MYTQKKRENKEKAGINDGCRKEAVVEEKVVHEESKKWDEGTKKGTKKESRGWRRERRSLAGGSEGCAPGDRKLPSP